MKRDVSWTPYPLSSQKTSCSAVVPKRGRGEKSGKKGKTGEGRRNLSKCVPSLGEAKKNVEEKRAISSRNEEKRKRRRIRDLVGPLCSFRQRGIVRFFGE